MVRASAPLLRWWQFGAWTQRLARFAQPEPIDVVEIRWNFLPRVFRTRGIVRRVHHIVRIWDRAARSGHGGRRYFEVTCQDGGHCVMFQDLQAGTWHLCAGG